MARVLGLSYKYYFDLIRNSPVDDEVIFKPINNTKEELDDDLNDNFDYENETFDEEPDETKGSSFNDEEAEVS